MQPYESLKHTTWECKYHVVFIPKCRRKALYAQLRRDLGAVFRGLAEQKECKVEEGHLMPDHVPMLLSVPPKHAVSAIMGVHQGEECDPHSPSVCWSASELCGPAFLGTGILGVDGGQERGRSAPVHPGPGKGGQTPRTDGDVGALSASR